MADDQYEGRTDRAEHRMADVVGAFIADVSRAESARQLAYVEALTQLSTPDKNGLIPTVTIPSQITGPDAKPLAGATISAPAVLAIMGEQLVTDTAHLKMTLNVHATSETHSDIASKQSGSGSGSVGFGPLKIKARISASASEHIEKKRTSDYRETCEAEVTMTRAPTPEPIQRILQATMSMVDVECELARRAINAAYPQREQARADAASGTSSDDAPADAGGDDQ